MPREIVRCSHDLANRKSVRGVELLTLPEIVYTYDMKLVNQDLDWINECKMHFLWWKPELNVQFLPANKA
jgi:hypothetical protein